MQTRVLSRSRSLELLPCYYEESSSYSQRQRRGSSCSEHNKDSGVASEEACSIHIQQQRVIPISTCTIAQHYYPEGGWGVVVVVCAALVHAISHGLHQAAGIIIVEMRNAFKPKPSLLDVGKYPTQHFFLYYMKKNAG
jgi:hypothetical protein